MIGDTVRCGSTSECIRRKSINTKNKSILDGLKPADSELVICKVGTKLGTGQKTQPKGCLVKRPAHRAISPKIRQNEYVS